MDGLETDGFTGDQSQQGQGLAYVLPQSRTTGYFMQLANEQAQQRRDDAAALAQAQQKQNQAYAQHLYDNKTPDIAKDYSQYLQPKFDDLLGQMADYHAKTGQDPYTNPDYIKQLNDLTTVAKNTHEANIQHTAYAAQIADKSKNYTPESKQAGIDWLNAYQKNPVSTLYSQPPPLVERNLDLNDAVKLASPISQKNTVNGYNDVTPDRHSHVTQLQTILSQPEFSPYLEQNGINSKVGDIGGQPNGTGGTVYYTDAPHLNSMADHILQNATQPHYAATLQAANIDANDPHAKDKLVELLQRQNAGYGRVLGQGADALDAKIKPEHVANTSEARLAVSEANLANSTARLADSQNKQAQNTAPIYRQKWISDMLNGVPGSGEQLTDKMKTDPAYDPSTKLGITAAGDNINFTIPAKRKYVAETGTTTAHWQDELPSRQITINKTDPNADIKLNSLVNQLTGENIDISALRTIGGKKHLPIVNNNIQQTQGTSSPTTNQPKKADPLGLFN